MHGAGAGRGLTDGRGDEEPEQALDRRDPPAARGDPAPAGGVPRRRAQVAGGAGHGHAGRRRAAALAVEPAPTWPSCASCRSSSSTPADAGRARPRSPSTRRPGPTARAAGAAPASPPARAPPIPTSACAAPPWWRRQATDSRKPIVSTRQPPAAPPQVPALRHLRGRQPRSSISGPRSWPAGTCGRAGVQPQGGHRRLLRPALRREPGRGVQHAAGHARADASC